MADSLNMLKLRVSMPPGLNPKGEVQLGKRGLYGTIGGLKERGVIEMAMLWVLNFSDGEHSLLDIAYRSRLDYEVVCRAAEVLCEHELLEQVG